jgi:hypothetical protein
VIRSEEKSESNPGENEQVDVLENYRFATGRYQVRTFAMPLAIRIKLCHGFTQSLQIVHQIDLN